MFSSNIALLTTRTTKDEWSVLASELIIDHKAVSRYDISYIFPLWITLSDELR